MGNTKTIVATKTPYLSQLSTFASSLAEELSEVSVESMKNEEQGMEKVLQSMQHDEEHTKYKISLMRYREKRMELEIKLMNRPEVEETLLVETSIEDDEKHIIAEIEHLNQRGKFMDFEIRRMKRYKTRLENEIQSMERNTEHAEHHLVVVETAFGRTENNDELHQNKTKLTHRENEPKELLAKHQMKLTEHFNELKKREAEFEQHHKERMKCEIQLKNLREKIKEKERIRLEKQNAIRQREYYQRSLNELRIERLIHEIELLERTIENIRQEIGQMKKDEKRTERKNQYSKLREQLSIKRNNLSALIIQESTLNLDSSRILHPEVSYGPLMHNYNCLARDDRRFMNVSCPILAMSLKSSMIIDPPKYEIFISYAYHDDTIVGRIKSALPQWYSTHVKGNFSSTNIKTCLDNTSQAVIAIINRVYELDKTCQADMTHIFKRQFPLVLVIIDNDFKPNTSWLTIVWHAPTTQKVFSDFPDFGKNLCDAVTNAEWNLSSNLNISKTTQPASDNRSKCFLGNPHEWNIVHIDSGRISQSYRQLITDPLRIATDTKLRDIYYKYISLYFKDPRITKLFEKGANENNMRAYIRGYTQTQQFSKTLNRDLAANILFYFGPTLNDSVDYPLVKCLIDFVALCIYRQELQQYLYSGTVYRGMVMSEEDLFKYVVGSRIMNTSFLSTSKDKRVTNSFSGEGQRGIPVICTYVIYNKNNRRTALDISRISLHPHEQEVLILPLSAFRVNNVTRSPDNSKLVEMTLIEDEEDTLEYMTTV